MDALAEFDDGTVGVIDFKTTNPNDDHVGRYSLQLHSYEHAVERPAIGAAVSRPVTLLGLACFEPAEMLRLPSGDLAYRTSASWLDVPRDDATFFAILDLVLGILEHPEPPPAAEKCQWCLRRNGGMTRIPA